MSKTVFISSTFEDLKEYREKIWDLLEKYDVDIKGMERFGARTETPLETCLAEVEQSQIYVGIIGTRYGSIDPNTGVSNTQREYEKAYEKFQELKKEILIYIIDDENCKVRVKFVDTGPDADKLKVFKKTLKNRHTCDSFRDEEDLIQKLKRKFDDSVSPKSEENEHEDEYVNSEKTIRKFLLLPKAYSGKEVKLKLQITKKPFPASKAICDSFNLEYGATIGSEFGLIAPGLDHDRRSHFEYIFIERSLVDDFLKRTKDKKELEVYAKVLFSERLVEKIRASFITKIERQYPNYFTLPNYAPKQTIIPGEGTIILKLKEII